MQAHRVRAIDRVEADIDAIADLNASIAEVVNELHDPIPAQTGSAAACLAAMLNDEVSQRSLLSESLYAGRDQG